MILVLLPKPEDRVEHLDKPLDVEIISDRNDNTRALKFEFKSKNNDFYFEKPVDMRFILELLNMDKYSSTLSLKERKYVIGDVSFTSDGNEVCVGDIVYKNNVFENLESHRNYFSISDESVRQFTNYNDQLVNSVLCGDIHIGMSNFLYDRQSCTFRLKDANVAIVLTDDSYTGHSVLKKLPFNFKYKDLAVILTASVLTLSGFLSYKSFTKWLVSNFSGNNSSAKNLCKKDKSNRYDIITTKTIDIKYTQGFALFLSVVSVSIKYEVSTRLISSKEKSTSVD